MRFLPNFIVLGVFLFEINASPAPEYTSPFTFSWPRETVLMTTGAAASLFGRYRVNTMEPAGPEDLDRSKLSVMDRWVAGTYSPAMDITSDILAVGMGGSAVFVGTWYAARNETTWWPVLEDFLILSEALAWSSAVNLHVRAERIHPRPFVYGTKAPASLRREGQAAGSFYSGHASEAFLGAVYFATSYPLRHPEFEHRGWLWAGSLTGATAAAVVRVAAGKHFPSDVIAGAAMGSLFGLGFAQLHRPEGLTIFSAQLWPMFGENGAPGLIAVKRF